MTTIESPPPAAPEPAPGPRRSGFYLSPWVVAVVGGLVLLGIGFVLGRVVDRRDHHDGPFFRGDGGGHPGVRILVVVIVLALLVTGVVLLVRRFAPPRPDSGASASPSTGAEQVLADRFARGEIDDAEFVRRRNALRS